MSWEEQSDLHILYMKPNNKQKWLEFDLNPGGEDILYPKDELTDLDEGAITYGDEPYLYHIELINIMNKMMMNLELEIFKNRLQNIFVLDYLLKILKEKDNFTAVSYGKDPRDSERLIQTVKDPSGSQRFLNEPSPNDGIETPRSRRSRMDYIAPGTAEDQDRRRQSAFIAFSMLKLSVGKLAYLLYFKKQCVVADQRFFTKKSQQIKQWLQMEISR